MKNNMFQFLDIETVGNCNRRCPTCIRNSHPDKDAIASWFSNDYLSEEVIFGVLRDATDAGFSGGICLSHYNEPLMDERIGHIARQVKRLYGDNFIYLHTNGDLLSKDIADELDGVLDKIIVTLYMDEPIKSKRCEWIKSLFILTDVTVITESAHIPTHFSPKYDVKTLAEKHRNHTCFEPSMRVIVNHVGEYLLCCDDVIGNFSLGSYPDKSIVDHWNEKMEIQKKLAAHGGREWHPYCLTCPRP